MTNPNCTKLRTNNKIRIVRNPNTRQSALVSRQDVANVANAILLHCPDDARPGIIALAVALGCEVRR